MLVSGSDFSRFVNCARQNIYKMVRENKLVKDIGGKYDLNNKINLSYILDHGKTISDISDYIDKVKEKKEQLKKNIKLKSTNKSIKRPKTKQRSNPILKKENKRKNSIPEIKEKSLEVIEQIEKNIKNINDITPEYFENLLNIPSEYMKKTMQELVFLHGGLPGIERITKHLNQLMMAYDKALKNEERNNKLVPKKYMKSSFFIYFNSLNKQLLNAPDSWIDYLIAIIQSDKATAKIKGKAKMKKDISLMIQQTQKKVVKESTKLISFDENENE